MALILNGPLWFRGIDAIFASVTVIITLLIALLSYKAYRLTQDSSYSTFSLSFFFLSISSFIFAGASALLLTHFSTMFTTVLAQFDVIFLVQMLLSLIAYILLLLIILKVTDRKLMALLISLILLFVLFSYQHFLKFHIVSFILLFFLTIQFYTNYLEKRNANAKLVFISFYILTAAEALFILFAYFSNWWYALAQVVQLIGYLLLFAAFLRIVYYGSNQKRKA